MNTDIKVAIVEDKAGIRKQWTQLLKDAEGFQMTYACATGENALVELPVRYPDVILMDIHLPGMSGIECTARLSASLPKARILMVTVYRDDDSIFKALQAGASGYLLKRCTGDQLLHAISEVVAGGAPMSGEIARRVIQSFQRPAAALAEDAELTSREMEVLGWVAKGLASKEVAEQLNISPRTVAIHLQHIYAKLHVRSRTEAAARYYGMTAGGEEPEALPEQAIPPRGTPPESD